MNEQFNDKRTNPSHRLISAEPKLWSVAHYGYEDWFGVFAWYVGDGVTSPSQHLVGVYDTKEEAEEAKEKFEAGDLADKPEHHDAGWKSRSLEVQPFRPADFSDRRSIENEGVDSVSRDVIRSAVEEGIWHAEMPAHTAVMTLLIVYAILDVSRCRDYGEVYRRLDNWSQEMSANGRWDFSFTDYDPDSWEVDGRDVRRVLGRSDEERIEAERGDRRLFRLAYSRDDDNCWYCKGLFEVDYLGRRMYDLIYDLESGEEIIDTRAPNNHAVAEALGKRRGSPVGT